MKLSVGCLMLLVVTIFAKKYDRIIVGCGAAGETYAYFTDLYHDKDILIIERGRDETSNPDLVLTSINRLFSIKNGNHGPLNIIHTREPNRDSFENTAANAMGGGYEVSPAVYQYPKATDLDHWRTLFNLTGVWNASVIRNIILQLENFSDISHTGVNDSYRGKNGLLKVMKMNGRNDPNLLPLINGYRNEYNLTFLDDYNAPDAPPTGYLAEHDRPVGHDVNNPTRQSLYRNYLKARALEPHTRVEIEDDSHVVKILFKDQKEHGKLVADSVIYIRNGEEKVAKLKNGGRLIVAAGQQVSSTLLELSGIGNCTLLQQYGIECLISRNGVGENLHDHPYYALAYLAPGREDKDSAIIVGNIRSPFQPGPSNLADSELSFCFIKTGFGVPIILGVSFNVEQLTSGSVHIQSPNPFYKPRIVQNFPNTGISANHDAWLFNETRRFIETYASPLLRAPIPKYDKSYVPYFQTLPEITSFLFELLQNEWHGAGTCRMGLESDPMAVVDERTGTVFGTSNLHVIDSTIHPYPMRGHPNLLIRGIAGTIAKLHHQMDDH